MIPTLMNSASNISSKIRAYARMSKAIKDEAQQLAVNTIYHAAKHGDPALMNTFFTHLTEGDKASFKRWVVAEVLSVYPSNTKVADIFVGMSKDAFIIKKDTTAHREAFCAYVEEVLAGEDASEFGLFFDINPDKSPKVFDDNAILKAMENLAKKAGKDGSEVHPSVKLALDEAVAFVKSKVPTVTAISATLQ